MLGRGGTLERALDTSEPPAILGDALPTSFLISLHGKTKMGFLSPEEAKPSLPGQTVFLESVYLRNQGCWFIRSVQNDPVDKRLACRVAANDS